MESEDGDSFAKSCYKCEANVLDNLDIVYNCSSSNIFLWNKYQIFMYKDTEFENLEKIFSPQFPIHRVLASNKYLICFDCTGNAHVISLKFKSVTQKCVNIPNQPRDRGITSCVQYHEDFILSLKYEADTYILSLNRINIDFQLEKQVILLCDNEHWPLKKNTQSQLLTTHSTNKDSFRQLNKLFNIEESGKGTYDFVVMSFDGLTVYGCLFSPKMTEEKITLVKIYQAPAEICNIEILSVEEICLVISLKMGVLIKISLLNTQSSPVTEYLNTSVYKSLVFNSSIIYTDGSNMWRANNTFSDNDNIQFTEIFLKNVKSFTKCGDQIICTTFDNLIYKFSLDDQSCYNKPKSIQEYCAAEKLFTNSAYANKIFDEMDRNNEIVQKMQIEEDYITALSLSKRQDIVAQAIQSKFTVYDNYQEVDKECVLTEEIAEYFIPNTLQILVTIANSEIYSTLNSVFIQLYNQMYVYITLSTYTQILKTSCIKMPNPLKAVHYLLPIITNHYSEIKVNIRIILNVPRALDQINSPVVLYKSDFPITAEHFIKTNQRASKSSLKHKKENIENVMQKFNETQYGQIFNFTNTTELADTENDWNFYVKLPNDFEQIFKSGNVHPGNLSLCKTKFIMNQLNEEKFLKSRNQLLFYIGNQKLRVKVQNDGFSHPALKITCNDAKIAFSMRNFFVNLIYGEYENYDAGKEFINYSFYTTTENFQKSAKKYIIESKTFEEFLPLMDQFEKNVVGALPL